MLLSSKSPMIRDWDDDEGIALMLSNASQKHLWPCFKDEEYQVKKF